MRTTADTSWMLWCHGWGCLDFASNDIKLQKPVNLRVVLGAHHHALPMNVVGCPQTVNQCASSVPRSGSGIAGHAHCRVLILQHSVPTVLMLLSYLLLSGDFSVDVDPSDKTPPWLWSVRTLYRTTSR